MRRYGEAPPAEDSTGNGTEGCKERGREREGEGEGEGEKKAEIQQSVLDAQGTRTVSCEKPGGGKSAVMQQAAENGIDGAQRGKKNAEKKAQRNTEHIQGHSSRPKH